MKRLILTLAILFVVTAIFAQVPQGLNFSATALDDQNELIKSQMVSLEISILEGTASGTAIYTEEHTTTTSDNGVFNIRIGGGTPTVGNFSDIIWNETPKYQRIQIDVNGGADFKEIGTFQFLSVPYSFTAGRSLSDFDTDSENEIQDLSIENDQLSLNKSDQKVDLSGYKDNSDNQQLSINGNDVTIEGGNTITINPNDADSDATNEIQDLTLDGANLTISQGSVVDLSSIANTDSQMLSIDGNDLSISGGNSVVVDTDPGNEIQNLGKEGDVLTLEGSNTNIDFSSYLDNTDHQELTTNGHVLTLTNGGSVDLIEYVNTDEQQLQLSDNILSISGGTSAIDLSTTGPWRNIDGNLEYRTETSGNVRINDLINLADDNGTASLLIGSGQGINNRGLYVEHENDNTPLSFVRGAEVVTLGSDNTKEYTGLMANAATNGSSSTGIMGMASNGQTSSLSIGGRFEAEGNGINHGVFGQAAGSATENNGVRFTASSDIDGSVNRGGYFEAEGRGNSQNFGGVFKSIDQNMGDNYGIYAEANNAMGSNIAGQFKGNVKINDGVLEINDSYTLPSADGIAHQVLTTDGTGNTTWETGSSLWTLNASNNLEYTAGNVEIPNGNLTMGFGTQFTGYGASIGFLSVSDELTVNSVADFTSDLNAAKLSVTGAFSLPTMDGTSGQVMSTDGSGNVTWVNSSTGTAAVTYSIGDLAQGGVIFWLDESGQHGLVCALEDQSSAMRWYAGSSVYTMARGDGPYSGEMNTMLIIAGQNVGDNDTYAARICNELETSMGPQSYGDWYLPSAEELNLMFLNKAIIDDVAGTNGGSALSTNSYWSSTENNAGSARQRNFTNGNQFNTTKLATKFVRAIRSF